MRCACSRISKRAVHQLLASMWTVLLVEVLCVLPRSGARNGAHVPAGPLPEDMLWRWRCSRFHTAIKPFLRYIAVLGLALHLMGTLLQPCRPPDSVDCIVERKIAAVKAVLVLGTLRLIAVFLGCSSILKTKRYVRNNKWPRRIRYPLLVLHALAGYQECQRQCFLMQFFMLGCWPFRNCLVCHIHLGGELDASHVISLLDIWALGYRGPVPERRDAVLASAAAANNSPMPSSPAASAQECRPRQ